MFLLKGLRSIYTAPALSTTVPPGGTWQPTLPSQAPTTPDAPNLELEKVAQKLYTMAQDPESLAKYRADPTTLVAGASLDAATTSTLTGSNVGAILTVLEKLVPQLQITSPSTEATARALRFTPTDQPSAIAGAVQLRAADTGSVDAPGVW
jgi:hypothetical protein